jgi:dTDP-glucose 4,6-dehydratase
MSRSVFEPTTVLVTGGAGFIGSNMVRWLLRNTATAHVVTLDALTYAGNLESLADVHAEHGPTGSGRHFFLHGDVRDAGLVGRLLEGDLEETGTARPIPPPDAVLHLAAESHVDRSILGPAAFVSANVESVCTLLECVRVSLQRQPRQFRFVNVSTDEVYGSLGPGDAPFSEHHPLLPRSPYAASKASGDCLARAYRETFGLPCLTTRCSNNYGPYQFPEKLIPLMITRAMCNQPLPVYGDGLHIRDWLHVEDHAAALWQVCTRGALEDEVYNIGGTYEIANLELVKRLLTMLEKPESLIRFVPDRLGHDRRYATDISKIRKTLGWEPVRRFDEGLCETVAWYCEHQRWWRRVQTAAYRASQSLYLAHIEC